MKRISTYILKKFFLILFFFVVLDLTGEDKYITFFATSDLHGNIVSKDSGILRLATLLKKEVRESGGADKSVIIDCGDFSQGTVEASLCRGKIIFELLDYLHYDVIVPGNHDFDYGLDSLIENKEKISPEMLCDNLLLDGAENPFKGWKILDKNGLKIAVIGLTYPGVCGKYGIDNSLFKTSKVEDSIKKIMPDLILKKPDLIVLGVHGGIYNSGWSLISAIKKFPEIDLVIGGHIHTEVPGKLLCNRTYFIQTGSHARCLGVINVKISDSKKEISSHLMPLSGVDVDSGLERQLAPSLAKLEDEKNRIVTCFKKKCYLTELAMSAMKKRANADIAILGLAESSLPIKGEITYKDLFNVISYEDAVATMTVNKEELKSIVQELYSSMKKRKKYKEVLYKGFFLEKKRGKIVGLTLDNKSIPEDKIVLAFPSYYVEYPSNKFPVIRKIAKKSKSGYKNSGLLVREALLDSLK